MTLLYIALGLSIFLFILTIFRNGAQAPIPKNISEQEIRALAQQGQKIQAIKAYRIRNRCDLKTAKAAVERMQN